MPWGEDKQQAGEMVRLSSKQHSGRVCGVGVRGWARVWWHVLRLTFAPS
jgi:hypothetical protein